MLIITGGLALTMDPGRELLENAQIVVDGNRIAEVTTDPGVLGRYPQARRIDARGQVVLPGLVSGHAHLRPMRAVGEGMDFETWHFGYVDGLSARMNREDAYFGAACAYLEMLKGGITTVLAMSIVEEGDMAAARDAGIRARIARHAERRPELEETVALLDAQAGGEEDRVRLWLGMEFVSMFSEPDLRYAAQAARRNGVPLHAHFGEGRHEDVGVFARGGLEGLPLLLAHCVRVDEQDARELLRLGAAVVHNPRSNMKFGIGAAPITMFRQLGVPVALGTDGPESTFACDLFAEMRSAVLLARMMARDATALSARDVLRMATIDGARALGLGSQVGSLEPGKKADIILVDLAQPHFRPLLTGGPIQNLEALLVFSASARDVSTVIVDGQVVVADRQVLTMDEKGILAAVQERGERLIAEVAAERARQN